MRRRSTVLAIGLSMCGAGGAQVHVSRYPLPAPFMKAGCEIREAAWIEREIAVLRCGQNQKRIKSLTDLRGAVEITTPETALQFARMFSTEGRWVLGVEPQMAEITKGAGEFRFAVPEGAVPKWFRAPEVVPVSGQTEARFSVGRTVVERDYQICWVVEEFQHDGGRRLITRRVVAKDGDRYGLFGVRGAPRG